MTEPPVESSRPIQDAFLDGYRQDLVAGQVRTLAEYQSQFPGHEAIVAEEWAWLEPESTTSSGDPGGDDAGHPRQVAPEQLVHRVPIAVLGGADLHDGRVEVLRDHPVEYSPGAGGSRASP